MAEGREIVAAFKKASTWGTAVAVGANLGILILSEGVQEAIESLPDDSRGMAFFEEEDKGNIDVAGSLNAYLRYIGLETMIALCMGTAGSPAQQEATAAYLHTLVLADNIDGKFGTLVIHKDVEIWEWPSVKVNGIKISGEAGQSLQIEFDLICDQLDLASSTNTSTQIDAVTYRSQTLRVMFNDGVFRWNAQSGDALDSDDAFQPSRFELNFTRNLAGDHVAKGDDYINEPTGSDKPNATLTLEFPEYTSDDRFDWLRAETALKGDITFTGGTIEGAYSYYFKLQMPHIKLTNVSAAVDGDGKIVEPIEALLLGASSAPTGMSGITKPFQVDIMNTLTSDPLA